MKEFNIVDNNGKIDLVFGAITYPIIVKGTFDENDNDGLTKALSTMGLIMTVNLLVIQDIVTYINYLTKYGERTLDKYYSVEYKNRTYLLKSNLILPFNSCIDKLSSRPELNEFGIIQYDNLSNPSHIENIYRTQNGLVFSPDSSIILEDVTADFVDDDYPFSYTATRETFKDSYLFKIASLIKGEVVKSLDTGNKNLDNVLKYMQRHKLYLYDINYKINGNALNTKSFLDKFIDTLMDIFPELKEGYNLYFVSSLLEIKYDKMFLGGNKSLSRRIMSVHPVSHIEPTPKDLHNTIKPVRSLEENMKMLHDSPDNEEQITSICVSEPYPNVYAQTPELDSSLTEFNSGDSDIPDTGFLKWIDTIYSFAVPDIFTFDLENVVDSYSSVGKIDNLARVILEYANVTKLSYRHLLIYDIERLLTRYFKGEKSLADDLLLVLYAEREKLTR